MIDVIRQGGFGAQTEVAYLLGLPVEKRRGVLVQELATAAGEAYRYSFTNDYLYEDGCIVDTVSGEPLGVLLGRSQRREEINAFQVIEAGVAKRDNVVVNFSPANINFGYPDNVVDIWKGDSGIVTWQRFHVEQTFEDMTRVLVGLGGEHVSSPEELLSKPLILDQKELNHVMDKLTIIEEKTMVAQVQIADVASQVVDYFTKKFGRDFLLNKDLVFRAYSAVMDQVNKMVKNKLSELVGKVKIAANRLYDYAAKPMVMVVQKVNGCSVQTTVGSFVDGATSWLSRIVGGTIELVRGATFDCPNPICGKPIPSGKGIEKCPHCGYTKQQAGSVCD